MAELQRILEPDGSRIDRSYSSGAYFADPERHCEDAPFKAAQFTRVLRRVVEQRLYEEPIRSYIDVGCGSGDVVRIVAQSMREAGFALDAVKGYDISPHVRQVRQPGIEFVYQDFCQSAETVDLVTLFDVFEHVPDPVQFLKGVAQHCQVMGLHIPLDHTWSVLARDAFRSRLRDLGHLIYLDTAAALNMLAFSGLRVIDYDYTLGFLAPSGQRRWVQRFMTPLRYALARVSPGLLSKTMGGLSLMVIARTT